MVRATCRAVVGAGGRLSVLRHAPGPGAHRQSGPLAGRDDLPGGLDRAAVRGGWRGLLAAAPASRLAPGGYHRSQCTTSASGLRPAGLNWVPRVYATGISPTWVTLS